MQDLQGMLHSAFVACSRWRCQQEANSRSLVLNAFAKCNLTLFILFPSTQTAWEEMQRFEAFPCSSRRTRIICETIIRKKMRRRKNWLLAARWTGKRAMEMRFLVDAFACFAILRAKLIAAQNSRPRENCLGFFFVILSSNETRMIETKWMNPSRLARAANF